MQLAHSSREYVRVALTATDDDGQPIPVTSPRLAFLSSERNPVETDWHEAELDEHGYARTLVGPGAIQLDIGNYAVWVSADAGAERPVKRAGWLRIY